MISKIKITNYEKIAIINTAFIGDIVLSFYLAQEIKNIHVNSYIIFITTPKVRELMPLVNSIDNVIYYDKRNTQKGFKGFVEIVSEIKKRGVELILSPHRSFRSSLLSFFSQPKFSVSFKNSSLGFLYKKTVEYLYCAHEIERNLQLLSIFEEFPSTSSDLSLDLTIPETLEKETQTKVPFEIHSNNLVAIAPGSIWKTKQWETNGFLLVAKELIAQNYTVFLLGSNEDCSICNYISSRTNAINLAGKTNLAESLVLLKNSQLLITNDSSPTHLATLVNCPTITIYGPTIPEFGFYPRAKKSRIIQIDGLHCRPCSIHGYNQCPLKHHKCMKEITPQTVINTALELLRKNP